MAILNNNMTLRQAQRLLEDLSHEIKARDLIQSIYVSIKDVGTRVFKNCCYHEIENYIFIWTENEKFIISRKTLGDFVIIPQDSNVLVSMRKNI